MEARTPTEFDGTVTTSPEETRSLGKAVARLLAPGDIVLLRGELGAGKTTLVRGLVESLGHEGPVRSPTFNLIQIFDTDPPVMHADLFRLKNAANLGLEEYLDTHINLIEWPDAAAGLLSSPNTWQIEIEFQGTDRRFRITKVFDER